MADEFEKMDDYLKKAFRDQKDAFQPEKDLKGFSDKVVKRILERQRSRQITFGIAMGFCVVAVFGLAMVFVLNQKSIITSEISQPAVQEQAAAVMKKEIVNEAREVVPAPAVPIVVQEPVTEETIAAEIEALKELGVWTEADEEEIGIPADAMFAEIQTYLETEQASIAMPSQQVAG